MNAKKVLSDTNIYKYSCDSPILIMSFILFLLFYQAFMGLSWSISCFMVIVTAVWVEPWH